MSIDGESSSNPGRERTLVGYAPAPVPRSASIPEGPEPAAHPAAIVPATVEQAPVPAAPAEEFAMPAAANPPVSADRRNPLSRRLPINRGRHLSRKFFEEGERQQEAGWEHSPLVGDTAAADPEIKFRSFDHVPKRRAPLLVVAMLGVVGVGTVVAWGSGWWSPRILGKSDIGLTLFLLGAASPPASASASPLPVAPSRPIERSGSALAAKTNSPTPSPRIAPLVRTTTAAPPIVVPAAARRSLAPSRRKASKAEHARPGPASRARQKQAAVKGYVWPVDPQQLVSSESSPPPVETVAEEPAVPEAAASETF